MTVGPLELLVLGFKSGEFKGTIAQAIGDAVDTNAIRVVDMFFVSKDLDGNVTAVEVEDSDDDYASSLSGFSGDVRDILTEDEVMTLAELLPVDTAALVALVEHTWALGIQRAVADAGGALLASQRISQRLMENMGPELESRMAVSGQAR